MGATATVFPKFKKAGNKVGIFGEDPLKAILDLQEKHRKELEVEDDPEEAYTDFMLESFHNSSSPIKRA
jgi:hypothetical protein